MLKEQVGLTVFVQINRPGHLPVAVSGIVRVEQGSQNQVEPVHVPYTQGAVRIL
jgi:hypothetical protein